MPGECLRDFRMDAAGGQVAYERVAQRVEVHHAAGAVFVLERVGFLARLMLCGISLRVLNPRRPRRFQVRPHHDCARAVRRRHRECDRAGQLQGQVRFQRVGRLAPQREHVFPPMFGIPRRNRDRRALRVQGEPLRRQGPQFIPPQAGFERDAVEHRAVRAWHPQDGRAGVCRHNQPPAFVSGQRAPLSLAIRAGIHALQVRDGVFIRAALRDNPVREALERRQVGIRRCGAQSALRSLPAGGQEGQDAGGLDFAPTREAATPDNLPDSLRSRYGMAFRHAARRERRLKIGDVAAGHLAVLVGFDKRLAGRRAFRVEQFDFA